MWLRVRLTGQAQKAIHRLHEASRVTYETTRTALKAPDSRQVRYYAELRQLLKVRARTLYSAPHPHITELPEPD